MTYPKTIGRLWHLAIAGACAGAMALAATQAAHAVVLGPTPYLSFADSPFFGGGFSPFHLEDFEDGLLNTPGVSASAGVPFGPSGITDSVDADDGTIDGSGIAGSSFFFAGGPTGITFTFDGAALGGLPTHAGLVWTDGFGDITFEAFDQIGASLGVLTGTHATAGFGGQTDEDRFYGAINAGGISSIFIRNAANSGIEVDHLQYGIADLVTPLPVPEPAGLPLLGAALVGMAMLRRRRRR
jgi:hypothetical protein